MQFVRPTLTFISLIFWGAFIAAGIDYPEKFEWVVVGMIVWWFGDRSYFKLKTLRK